MGTTRRVHAGEADQAVSRGPAGSASGDRTRPRRRVVEVPVLVDEPDPYRSARPGHGVRVNFEVLTADGEDPRAHRYRSLGAVPMSRPAVLTRHQRRRPLRERGAVAGTAHPTMYQTHVRTRVRGCPSGGRARHVSAYRGEGVAHRDGHAPDVDGSRCGWPPQRWAGRGRRLRGSAGAPARAARRPDRDAHGRAAAGPCYRRPRPHPGRTPRVHRGPAELPAARDLGCVVSGRSSAARCGRGCAGRSAPRTQPGAHHDRDGCRSVCARPETVDPTEARHCLGSGRVGAGSERRQARPDGFRRVRSPRPGR